MKRFVSAMLFMAIMVLFPVKAAANTAPISWKGTKGSEPYPMEDCPIQVEGERLEFQLESMKYGYTIRSRVEAEYSLYNPTEEPYAMTAVFPFISGKEDEQDPLFQKVLLDGKEIPYQVWTVEPEEGQSPESLLENLSLEKMLELRKPFIPRDEHFFGDPDLVLLLEFEAELPPKAVSKLEVRTKTTAFMERDVIWTYGTTQTRYTFHYFLSPARHWASFQNLEVVLKTSSAAPILKESNADFRWAGWRRYRFRSETLPEGELTFTLKRSFWYTPVRWAVLIGIVTGGLVWWGRRRAEKQ